MSIALYNNYSPSTPQQSDIPLTFYDDISSIIKLFRRQLTLHIKLSSTYYQDKQLIDEIQNKKTQGLQIAKPYQSCIMMENFYGIIQRFIGRIKQIMQFTNNLAPGVLQYITNGIKKIEISAHKNVSQITIFQIINDILNLIPSSYKNKTFSPQKIKIKVKENKENIPLFEKKPNTLNIILESYKRNYSLISILDLDEAEYRSLFFSARQDKSRGTNFLQNDMKFRNRFIREEMQKFDMDFQCYKEKLRRAQYVSNKKKVSKMKRMMSLSESAERQRIKAYSSKSNMNPASPVMRVITEKDIELQNIIQKQQLYQKMQKSNLLTTAYNFNQACLQQNRYPPQKSFQKYKQRFNKTNNNFIKSPKTNNDQSIAVYSDKIREQQFQDFINQIKVKGQFRMTKVLFGKDGKLELSPHVDVKTKNNGGANVSQGIKNKIIFRKVQENIKKKFNNNNNNNRVITQPPSFTNKVQKIMNQTHVQKSLNRIATQTPTQTGKRQRIQTQLPISQTQPQTQQNNYNLYYEKYEKYQRNYMNMQVPQNKKTIVANNNNNNNKKSKKFTWKDKQIKFLGIKGVNNTNFVNINGNTKNNFYYKNTQINYDMDKSLLLGNGADKKNRSQSYYQ